MSFSPKLKGHYKSLSPLPKSFSDTHEEFSFQNPVLPPPLKASPDTCLPGKTTPFRAHNLASLVFNFFFLSLIKSLLTQHYKPSSPLRI